MVLPIPVNLSLIVGFLICLELNLQATLQTLAYFSRLKIFRYILTHLQMTFPISKELEFLAGHDF